MSFRDKTIEQISLISELSNGWTHGNQDRSFPPAPPVPKN